MNLPFDIVVIASKHRPSLIQPHLKQYNHVMSYTPDYELPKGWVCKPEYKGLLWNALGTYRCFRGQQDAIRKVQKEFGLIFEDDAVPNCKEWMDVVLAGLPLLKEVDSINYHVRNLSLDKPCLSKTINGHTFTIRPNGVKVYLHAAMAYIIKRDLRNRIVDSPFDGYPFDLLLPNTFSTALIHKSPFEHDRRFGSLVENPK